jgi:hypothetical protein
MTPKPKGHMASYIARRKFLATLGGAAAPWPLAARAQQAKAATIGLLGTGIGGAEPMDCRFRAANARVGWVEGTSNARHEYLESDADLPGCNGWRRRK